MKEKGLCAHARDRHGQIFGRRELDEQLWNLKRPGDTEPGDISWRAPCDIHSVERDRAAIGLEITGDHVDEGCFARAVGADQADLLTGRDIDRQGVGGDYRAKALFKSTHGKDRVHSATSFSAAMGAAAVELFFLCLSLIQSEPMPRGRNRMTPNRKTPSTSCQVLGRYRFEKERTSSSAIDATNT